VGTTADMRGSATQTLGSLKKRVRNEQGPKERQRKERERIEMRGERKSEKEGMETLREEGLQASRPSAGVEEVVVIIIAANPRRSIAPKH
jgi:hypothetical protein